MLRMTKRRRTSLPDVSSLLTSQPIEVEVGNAPKETFLIHKSLLCMESEKYRALLQGTGDWKEKSENKITIVDEDPKLFRSYAKYLYYDDWTYQNDDEESCIVHLARLYCLGDRLVAKRFQESILWRFDLELNYAFVENVSDDDLCGILEVAFSELPERPDVDPLQRKVARLGASRLFDLQKYPRFKDELSKDVPEITRRMCLCMAPMELRDLEKERLLQNKRKTTARGVKCDQEEKSEHPLERFYI
ncbi:uncharacterized protein BKA78DRAFT_70600 [Phyllosticta capitalensis]|uniref:uncharacterized protein n=1 Tax=Phyllosticta capitalensis TaxID=121624 RepID=UPI00312D04E8